MVAGTDPGGVVREAPRSDHHAISACLSRAFEDDPVSHFIFPRESTRASRLERFYREVIRITIPHGRIYTDAGIRGGAIWRAPSAPPTGRMRAILDGLAMLRVLRRSVNRALLLEQAISSVRPRDPYWYLAILGTDPSQQGRGVGSALIEPVLSKCDAEHIPAYLESSKEKNIPFYQRHGFRVTRKIEIPDGPALWSMLREPHAADPEGASGLNREAGTAD